MTTHHAHTQRQSPEAEFWRHVEEGPNGTDDQAYTASMHYLIKLAYAIQDPVKQGNAISAIAILHRCLS